MHYARKVHVCMNFLRIDKKPKNYQMLLAETQYGSVRWDSRKATSAMQRHTSHTSVTATCTRNNVKIFKMHTQHIFTKSTGSSLQHGQCPRSPSCFRRLPVAATLISISIHLKLHLLLLSLSFLFYILLTSSVHMYLSTFRSLGGLCFSSMVNTELCSSPLRIPRQAWHQLINQNSVVAFSQIAITQYITYGLLSSDLLRTWYTQWRMFLRSLNLWTRLC